MNLDSETTSQGPPQAKVSGLHGNLRSGVLFFGEREKRKPDHRLNLWQESLQKGVESKRRK